MSEGQQRLVDVETGEALEAPEWLDVLREMGKWQDVVTLDREEKLLAWAAAKGIPDSTLERVANAMAAKEAKVSKDYTNLDRAFRNWVLNEIERSPRRDYEASPRQGQYRRPFEQPAKRTAAEYLRQRQPE